MNKTIKLGTKIFNISLYSRTRNQLITIEENMLCNFIKLKYQELETIIILNHSLVL